MGSGAWPLAMATRPAKLPVGGGIVRVRVRSVWRPRGAWRCTRAVVRRGSGRAGDQADRAISTGQLRGLLPFHLRPIDVVVYHGSRRDLVLRRVSRLDAFSGYPVRT